MPQSNNALSPGGLARGALVVALKAIVVAFAVATPLLGIWVASSLAAYANGPVGLTAVAGLLLFPILPVAWDLFASWRRNRRGAASARILTTSDRLVLRTLALNVVFLTVLLATFPERAFAALSTRGDWMLERAQGPRAQVVRHWLFAAADGLEWLYLAAHDNP